MIVFVARLRKNKMRVNIILEEILLKQIINTCPVNMPVCQPHVCGLTGQSDCIAPTDAYEKNQAIGLTEFARGNMMA